MEYKTTNSYTVSVGSNDVIDKTVLVIEVAYKNGESTHLKTFEFPVTATDEEIQTAVIQYGQSIKGDPLKERKITLEGIIS